jgi:hypothetical protein
MQPSGEDLEHSILGPASYKRPIRSVPPQSFAVIVVRVP